MAKPDITKLNDAIDRLMAVTTNLRHRFMLSAFARHRLLEVAGRYPEIFAPDMMVEKPVYRFNALGLKNVRLEGADAVKGLYGMWAQTHQSIFVVDREQIAVADNFIASVAWGYQQVLGEALIANGIKVDDPKAYYKYSLGGIQQFWPYDDRGRLVGEDVWEPDPDKAVITKLDPADVMTTQEAAMLLNPMIKPLPSFDEMVLGRRSVTA
jgi:hypothetical protein